MQLRGEIQIMPIWISRVYSLYPYFKSAGEIEAAVFSETVVTKCELTSPGVGPVLTISWIIIAPERALANIPTAVPMMAIATSSQAGAS
jgi:hypothetical protein